jgi:hypothetical protein
MDHLFLLKILMDHLGSKKTNHQDNLMHKYMHGSPRSKLRTFQIHSRVVAVVCFVGVATAISWSKLVPMWTWSSVMTDRRMESLNDVKHIVNGKDRYTDGKILKTDMGYVPELQEEASRTEVVVGGGGGSELQHVKSLLHRHLLYML